MIYCALAAMSWASKALKGLLSDSDDDMLRYSCSACDLPCTDDGRQVKSACSYVVMGTGLISSPETVR